MAIEMLELERRVSLLERDRINHMALINALVTTQEHLWSIIMQKGLVGDPVEFAQKYLNMPHQMGRFPGSDPSYLDVLSQVYEERIADFRSRLLKEAQRVAQKNSGQGED